MENTKTLVEKLRQVCLEQPDFLQYTFLKNNTESKLTARELDWQARCIAASIAEYATLGERVILLYPSGLEFISALFGCFYAQVIAVPIYSHQFQASKLVERLKTVLEDTGAKIILTLDEVVQSKNEYIELAPWLEDILFFATDLKNNGSNIIDEPSEIDPESIAFLQYSSGSTGTPKGVMVSHENLMANLQIIRDSLQLKPHESVVSWLPFYHDMGLIGNILGSVFSQSQLYMLSPFEFIRKPFYWLQLVSKTKARVSGGPNFAYDLCTRLITQKQCEDLDLSSWAAAYNGAEPVRETTLRAFEERFAPYGFKKEAFQPCYGLAEATLMVTNSKLDSPPEILRVDRKALANGQVQIMPTDDLAVSLVSSGCLIDGQDVEIVNPDSGKRCELGRIGEIWVSGRSVCKGYWNRPSQTQSTFFAKLEGDTFSRHFLRTGDLGFLDNGCLYVTGRLKDLIIIRGQNHYPEDIESTVMNSHPLLHHRRAAAFSIERDGQECLVILVSKPKGFDGHSEEIIQAIRRQVSEKHELAIHDLVIVKNSLPVTSSGKIQRHECKRLYLQNEIEVVNAEKVHVQPKTSQPDMLTLPNDARFAIVLQRLQQLLAQELRISFEKINILDSLNALDSLSKVRLQHQIQDFWGVLIGPELSFSEMTLVQLAREVSDRITIATQPAQEAISFSEQKEYPPSHSQQSLYFLHNLITEKSAYNISRAAKVPNPLNVDALRTAFKLLIKRHVSLRTSFFEQGGKLLQKVEDSITSDIDVFDARAWSEAEFNIRLESAASKPFSLESGQLIRLSLYQRETDQILLFSVHHIVSDFWSLSLLIRDLGEYYFAEVTGTLPELIPIKVQPNHYVQYEEHFLQSPRAQELRKIWCQELANPSPLDLPTDYSRPAVKTYQGSTLSFHLSPYLSDKIHSFARQYGVTSYVVLLSAYSILLHRYTEKPTIMIGSPMANRVEPQFANFVSYLVNPVVIRADFTPAMTLRNVIEQMHAKTKFADTNQQYPLSKLIEDLNLKRDPSTTPLFQAMFSYLNPIGGNDIGGFALGQAGSKWEYKSLILESFPLKTHGAQFDLNVGVSIICDQIASTWEYSTDLFKEETIERMADHFELILTQIITYPNQLVDAFTLLSEKELHQIAVEWNDTETDYGQDQPLHYLFEKQAQRTPDFVAIRNKNESLSYDVFNRRANQLAHYLHQLGVGPQTIVGIHLHRSIDLVVALYAVLKTGAAYMPIAPDYPQNHIDWVVSEAKPKVILTERGLASAFDAVEGTIVVVDTERDRIHDMSEHNLLVTVDPDSVAYIIYTSGSTGKPKGVMIPHKGITNRILWMQEKYQLTLNDLVLQKTPYTFDVSVWEFFWPLATGASLYVIEPNGHKDPDYLIDTITKNAITTLHFVPSMLRPFLDHPRSTECKSLRRIFCSGEALSVSLAQQCLQQLDIELHNLYGPTEASVDVSYWQCMRNEALHTIPVGFPIANMQLYILDRLMQLVPIGVHGELYIGGKGLAKGYINQPQLTAERFVANPFSTNVTSKLYKTGDRCRYQPSGAIEFLGRIDTQVKIRGFRIELEAVEIALSRHPMVSEAVASAVSDPNGNIRLAVYYVPASIEIPASSILKQYLSQHLPEYMVPSIFVPLNAFPLLSSGKVDRKALLEIKDFTQETKREYIKPETLLEKMLCTVYEEILGLKQVGVNDNFFDLGGDSILVLRVVAKIRDQGQDVTVQQLYSNLPIREVASNIQHTLAEKLPDLQPFSLVHSTDVLKLPESLEDAYPLSKMQEGLVFHSEFSADYETYVMGLHVDLRLDEQCLLQALDFLTSRHALLRTCFDFLHFSEPLQLVHRQVSIPIKLFDIMHLSTAEQEREIDSYMREEKWRKFFWTEAPFLRITVHKRGPTSNQFTFSHPLFDGWSMGLLITEFFTIYGALLKNMQPPLNPAPLLSYRDFVALEKRTMQSEATIHYWKEKLAGMEYCELPRFPSHRKPRPATHTRITVEVESKTLQGLQQLAKIAEVPFKSVLLAAHMRVVGLLTGRHDIITGLLANGRPEQLEGDKIVGMFLNTVPFRMQLAGGNWIALVKDAFYTESALLPHRRFPLAELVRMVGNGKQLFETAFNYIHFHIYKALKTVPDLSIIDWKSPSDQTYFPLTAYFHLDISHESSKLLFFLDVDQGVLAEQQIDALPQYYLNTLQAMATDFYAEYKDISLLPVEEYRRITYEWNPKENNNKEKNLFVHQLISLQAARLSEKIAVVCDDQHFNYSELENQSNCLANYLIEKGIGPNKLVAVCLNRSIDLVIALLAVMKAGGAYVPVDPSYPKERLTHMLHDAQPSIVITETMASDNLPSGEFELIRLDTDWQVIQERSNKRPEVSLDIEDLAYVIYTSGSTGQPKGVEIPHRALGNFIASIQKIIDWSEDDVLLAVTTISFDIAGLELYLPLTTGAKVVLATREIALDGTKLAEMLCTAGITTMQATPATWRMLMSVGWTGLTGLKALCGGESMPSDLAKDLLARGCYLWNLYGPTETTIWSTAWRVEVAEDLIPIGRPIDNTNIYILDEWGHPVPVGVVGELYIGGQGVARGYRNRSELTAQRFYTNHFSSNMGTLMYRTGDLARFRPDGVIECLGRVDHQVKVRGFRIELGEIETHLTRFVGIERAIAKVIDDGKGDARIVAYLLSHVKHSYSTTELRRYLEDILPIYMIPAAFVVLESFPLTPNGKVDWKALPAPQEFRPQLHDAYVPPSSDLEKTIAAIYAQMLGVEHIGIDDNFFDLGGHSLLLVRIHGQLQELLTYKFPITKLFEYPTVRKITSFFETKVKTQSMDAFQRAHARQGWVEKQEQRRRGVKKNERN